MKQITQERADELAKLSDAVAVAVLAPIEGKNLSIEEGLTVMAIGLTTVITNLCKVIGSDPKEMQRAFIGALQDDLERQI